MPDYTDTAAYPVFATKKALIRQFLEYFQHNGATAEDFVFSLNNTDLTGLADGATIFDPADTFESA